MMQKNQRTEYVLVVHPDDLATAGRLAGRLPVDRTVTRSYPFLKGLAVILCKDAGEEVTPEEVRSAVDIYNEKTVRELGEDTARRLSRLPRMLSDTVSSQEEEQRRYRREQHRLAIRYSNKKK